MNALMIGVSGMRGTIGRTLTPEVIARMTAAFAVWVKRNTGKSSPRVAFGRDTRPSGTFVRDVTVGTLAASGCEVIDLGVVTTPGVAMSVRHLDADAGVVATASHNPIEWNGLKFLTADAVAPPADAAATIRRLYDEQTADYVDVSRLRPVRRDDATHALHVGRVLSRIDVLGVSSRRYKVVLDSVNGAGCVATATLLSKLGCQIVHLNGTPDGQFPHPPEPTAENLQKLCEEVRRQRAHVGFAQDPDADRLAIVDENGRYVGEEYSLAIVARHLLAKKPGSLVVTNLSTSRMVDDLADRYGGRVIRTPVGEANVIDAMLRENALVGGEGNGGVIDPRVVPGRDSLVAIAYVLQLLAESGRTVSQLVAEWPAYEIVKTKLEVDRAAANRAVTAVRGAFDADHTGAADVRFDEQDGLRVDVRSPAGDAWVHVRPSNTEPIMRIIAEAPTRDAADALIARVRRVVDATLAG